MTAAATIIYHATVMLLLSWRTSAASSDILQATSSYYYFLQPSSTYFVMEESISTVMLFQSSVLNTAALTSLSTLPTTETPLQPSCFIGGSTGIKENHSLTSNNGLYLQFVKRSNCGLSKRTLGIRFCYKSSSSIFVEATLWIRTLNTYNKFATLVQTNLPISLNETCRLINVDNQTFVGNTFIGIKIANSTSNGGIILNPTEASNWCIFEGYQINDKSLESHECVQIDMNVAVAALFYPWTPATESTTGDDSGIESGAIVGIIVGTLIFVLVIFILFFVTAFYWRRKKSYIISNKSDDGANKIEIFKINHHYITESKTDTARSTRYYNIQTQLQDTGNSTSDTLSSDPTSGSDSLVDMIPNPHATAASRSAAMGEVQTYERPALHSPMEPEPEASKTFVNPCFFLMNDLPPTDRSRVMSCVCAEPIFDSPIDPPVMSSTTNACSYENPATDVKTLTLQLKKAEVKKIKRNDLRIVKELGCGAFGLVSLAIWAGKHVAVKTLNSEATEDEKVTFLQEATIMSQFAHDNVIKLLAIIKQEPVGIVIEFASRGDLHKFLIELKPDIMEGELVLDTVPQLLLQFGRQVAAGMHYLSSKFFVHRDLAARNILINEDLVCKIADFGMSRDLEEESFYVVSGGKIPVKWTAPEALYHRKFTTLSDVWSFGCVLYEMWSLGGRPFENTTARDAIVKIAEGYRLPPPPGCPNLMYKLMIRCWHPDPESRPIFALIIRYLNKPVEELLSISEEDRQTAGTRATTLGYPLSDGINLYKDLQLVYVNADDDK